MATVVLVHGGMHGAWCWELLTPHLQRLGHRVVAPDLPCSDPQLGNVAYADLVRERIPADADDVVVVGHSLACLVIPLVAARRPVARLVYLCGTPAQPGMSFADQVAHWPDMLLPTALGERAVEGGRHRRSEAQAVEAFYHDLPSDVAHAAYIRLRPQSQAPHHEVCPLPELPSTPCTYIMATDDRMVNPRWVRRTIPDRLGVQPLEIAGSHSPFLSRPAELASMLDRIVQTAEVQSA